MYWMKCHRCGNDETCATLELKRYCRRCVDKIGTAYKPKIMSLEDLKKDLKK